MALFPRDIKLLPTELFSAFLMEIASRTGHDDGHDYFLTLSKARSE